MRAPRAVALFVSVAAISSACNGSVTADDYFAELRTITATLDAQLDDVEGSFNAGLLDINFEAPEADRQFIELFQNSITGVSGSFAEMVAGLQELEPPSDLAGPHREAVDAGLLVLGDYETRVDQLSAIATVADIDSYADSLATSVARSRFVESCRRLQGIADREQIDVDLSC